MVECWDPRARSAVGCVKLPNPEESQFSVSKLKTETPQDLEA